VKESNPTTVNNFRSNLLISTQETHEVKAITMHLKTSGDTEVYGGCKHVYALTVAVFFIRYDTAS
jgi:hypothetical protein